MRCGTRMLARDRYPCSNRKGMVRLEVSDDGIGFVARKVNKLGLGLHHIEARARKLGRHGDGSFQCRMKERELSCKLGKA